MKHVPKDNMPIKHVFIPPFTPPPVTKDWERSFASPFDTKDRFPRRENARTLRSLHFFFNTLDVDENE